LLFVYLFASVNSLVTNKDEYIAESDGFYNVSSEAGE